MVYESLYDKCLIHTEIKLIIGNIEFGEMHIKFSHFVI